MSVIASGRAGWLTIPRVALAALLVAGCGGGGGNHTGPTVTSTNPLVVSIGDSITEGTGEVPYPRRLESLLKGRNPGARVNNRGTGGQHLPEGLDTLAHALAADHPGFVTILEGTNDITAGRSADSIADLLRRMMQLAKGSGVVPVVGTLPPQFGPRAVFQDRVVAVNERIRQVAREEGVTLADVFAALPDASFLQGDGLHPNNTGAAAIADTFNAALIRAGYPAARILARGKAS